jgi:hypothetical protein
MDWELKRSRRKRTEATHQIRHFLITPHTLLIWTVLCTPAAPVAELVYFYFLWFVSFLYSASCVPASVIRL